MSDNNKNNKAMELSAEELDAVAGGAFLDTQVNADLQEEAFASAEETENSDGGFKTASVTIAKKTVSEGDFSKSIEI